MEVFFIGKGTQMIAPLRGSLLITQLFGGRPLLESYKYWDGKSYITVIGHTGIDFNAVMGTNVFSVYSGRITIPPYQGNGLGNWVTVITPQGVQVDYGHLSIISVLDGHNVNAGDRIGLSGDSGNTTGPHLHLQCRNPKYNIYNGYLGYHDFICDFDLSVIPQLDLQFV